MDTQYGPLYGLASSTTARTIAVTPTTTPIFSVEGAASYSILSRLNKVKPNEDTSTSVSKFSDMAISTVRLDDKSAGNISGSLPFLNSVAAAAAASIQTNVNAKEAPASSSPQTKPQSNKSRSQRRGNGSRNFQPQSQFQKFQSQGQGPQSQSKQPQSRRQSQFQQPQSQYQRFKDPELRSNREGLIEAPRMRVPVVRTSIIILEPPTFNRPPETISLLPGEEEITPDSWFDKQVQIHFSYDNILQEMMEEAEED